MNPRPLRCAISDRNAGTDDARAYLLRQAERLAVERVNMFQVREKDLPAGELTNLVRALLVPLRGSQTKLLVNGRADVAIAARADGVHLTSSEEELTPLQVHRLYAQAGLPDPVVTRSCHSIEEIMRHRLEPLAAILFGPVFEKSVAGERLADGTGVALLRQACKAAAPVPVLALGGVTPEDMGLCLDAGAGGIAGIRLFQ